MEGLGEEFGRDGSAGNGSFCCRNENPLDFACDCRRRKGKELGLGFNDSTATHTIESGIFIGRLPNSG